MTVASGNAKTLRGRGTGVTVLRPVGGSKGRQDWLVRDGEGNTSVVNEADLEVPIETDAEHVAMKSEQGTVVVPDFAYSAADLYFADDTLISAPATVTDSGTDPVEEFVDKNGVLPVGFTLDAETGAIGGTPTARLTAGTAVVIRGYNAGRKNFLDVTVTLHVGTLGTYSYVTPQNLTVATPMATLVPTSTGDGTPVYTVKPGSLDLPTGLALNAANGEVTGTPTVIGESGRVVTFRKTTEYGVVDSAPVTFNIGA